MSLVVFGALLIGGSAAAVYTLTSVTNDDPAVERALHRARDVGHGRDRMT